MFEKTNYNFLNEVLTLILYTYFSYRLNIVMLTVDRQLEKL